MLSKMSSQGNHMGVELALRNIIIQFLKFLDAIFLVKFKIIANSIFGNSNQFYDLGMC